MSEQYISKITLPSGNQYIIKDKNVWGSDSPETWANNLISGSDSVTDVIETLKEQISAITGGDAIVFKGVSSTALTDGGNENPTISGSAVTTKTTGDLYFYEKQEFIYGDDNKWHSLGPQLQSLGTLAYKSSSTVKYDKTTGVGSTFSGSETSFTGAYTPAGSISLSTSNKTAAVSQASSGSTTYKPAGTVSQPTFTGAELSATGSYTPGGSVSTPTISVQTAGTTATIKNPTKVTVAKTVAAAAPSSSVANEITYYSVANENLTLYKIGYTTGDSITTSNVTVKTGDAAYQNSAPSFTGTAATVTTTGTPTGTVSKPTFTGTAVRLVTGNIAVPTTATFSGTAATVTVSGTPLGNVTSAPTHTSTDATVTYS